MNHYIYCRINNREPTKIERALFDKPLLEIHHRNFDSQLNEINANGNCIPGVRRLFVDVFGNYYPCERTGQAFNIGNIHTGTEKNKIKKIFEDYIKQSCEICFNCWAVRLCTVCLAQARKGNYFDINRKTENCTKNTAFLSTMFQTYATILEENPNGMAWAENRKLI